MEWKWKLFGMEMEIIWKWKWYWNRNIPEMVIRIKWKLQGFEWKWSENINYFWNWNITHTHYVYTRIHSLIYINLHQRPICINLHEYMHISFNSSLRNPPAVHSFPRRQGVSPWRNSTLVAESRLKIDVLQPESSGLDRTSNAVHF